MKTFLPERPVTLRIIGTVLILIFFRGQVMSQATAMLKYGNSYVNLSKKAVGGPVEPGDTLEIRTNFYVNKSFNISGLMYKVRYYDNLPTNTAMLLSDSLRLISNEGITCRHYTIADDHDPGTFIQVPPNAGDYQIRINMGGAPSSLPTYPTGADYMGLSNTTGASTITANNTKPKFSNGSIFCTAFRVVVTGNYGDTITLGAGRIAYRTAINSLKDSFMIFNQYKILISPPSTLCSSSTSTNFAAESGGTFGHGAGRNRATGPTFPIPNYTYLPLSDNNTQQIGDGYYAIVNNISPTSSTYPNAVYAGPGNPCNGVTGVQSCANREFTGFWFITGDHTGTTTAAGNPPPDNNTDAGYMLLVNSDLATSEAYHQVINGLCPNTFYQFSAWFKNVCPNCGIDTNSTSTYKPGVLPNLTLVIDSVDRMSTGQLLDTDGWLQKGFTFVTGPTETSITISIRNNAPGGGGNDWALDDITLATCPPDLLLTPNKPDTLCQGADDTVRFKISSFVNNYTQWELQKSTDGGAHWAATGLDTLNRADNGSMVPVKDPLSGLYIDTVTRYFRIAPTDNTIIYRIVVASTVANLANSNCSFITTQPKTVRGVNCLITLPTSLLYFRGQVKGGLGNLVWASENETSGLNYTVERSDDGIHFSSIGTLPARGGEGQGATYTFVDPQPVAAQSYYRLSMNMGTMKRYSNVVLLSNSSIAFEIRSVLNPFIDHLTIDLTTPGDGLISLSLVDMYGRYLRRVRQPVTQGLNNLSVYGLSGLPDGTYALQIQYNDEIISRKVVKAGK